MREPFYKIAQDGANIANKQEREEHNGNRLLHFVGNREELSPELS